jgi:hypothetical protein
MKSELRSFRPWVEKAAEERGLMRGHDPPLRWASLLELPIMPGRQLTFENAGKRFATGVEETPHPRGAWPLPSPLGEDEGVFERDARFGFSLSCGERVAERRGRVRGLLSLRHL